MKVYDIYNIATDVIFSVPCFLISLCYLPTIKNAFKITKEKNDFSCFSDIIFHDYSFITKKILAILLHLLFIVIILFNSRYFVINTLGCEDIRAMPEGEYCYYVEATNEKGKTYTLPAKIIKSIYEYSDYVGDEERIRSKPVYCVENVYFKNGGYLYFDSYETFGYYESQEYYAQDEREWEIKLTNQKAYHYRVDETPIKHTFNDYLIYFLILLHLITLFAHCYFLYKHNPCHTYGHTNANSRRANTKRQNKSSISESYDLSKMTDTDRKEYEVFESMIRSLTLTKQVAERNLNEIKLMDLNTALKNNQITKKEYESLYDKIQKLNILIETTPKKIQVAKDSQKKILSKYNIK